MIIYLINGQRKESAISVRKLVLKIILGKTDEAETLCFTCIEMLFDPNVIHIC